MHMCLTLFHLQTIQCIIKTDTLCFAPSQQSYQGETKCIATTSKILIQSL